MLKRFLIFGYDYYDAGGGWRDFQGDFDFLDEASIAGKETKKVHNSVDIVDTLVDPPIVYIIDDDFILKKQED